MSMRAAPARASTVSRALARDKLGMFAVLAFILASIAPMTVCAGVIPTAYAVTGLTGIPVAFLVVAVVLALFCPGYVAMARRIRNAGSFRSPIASAAASRNSARSHVASSGRVFRRQEADEPSPAQRAMPSRGSFRRARSQSARI